MNKVKIIVSPHSGFCFGVQRALDIAKKALEKRKIIYSLGPIIHNPQVVDEFSEMGLKVLKDTNKTKSKNAAILIPSHGINPNLLKGKKIAYIDTTCPLVGRVQRIVEGLKRKGCFVIIVGDKRHPEVEGLVGIAGRNCCVIKDRKEARVLHLKSRKVALISQTTASLQNFKEILCEISKKDFMELVSINTVCKNTIARQKEATSMAKAVDAMIVIGGKNSANTTKLAEICKRVNKNTYHVESKDDLNINFFKDMKRIGIAAGASTPPYAINEVIKKIRGE